MNRPTREPSAREGIRAVASFAMAGSRVSLTGGIHAYVDVAFGPLVGFLTGFLVWLSCLLATASVASALATSVWCSRHSRGSTSAGGISARLVEAVTVAKLLPLVALTAAGLLWVTPEHLVIEWASPDRTPAPLVEPA